MTLTIQNVKKEHFLAFKALADALNANIKETTLESTLKESLSNHCSIDICPPPINQYRNQCKQ